ncbi:MAG: efflux RND transporter periplasmic adaptor subunit [Planctomycetia bacterium]|nr:efflux RND transporter periplasmic adaptor subunit [Planctomycetia bacterium]
MISSRFSGAWLLCGALAIAGCGNEMGGNSGAGGSTARGESAAGGGPLVKVTPIAPVRKTLVRWTVQPGQVEAFEETPLFAKLASYVEKMHADIGDRVTGPEVDDQGQTIRDGQLLAELSVPELDEELAQKEASVGQAKAELQQAVAAIKVARASESAARAKVEESEAVVDQSQADYEFAASEFARLKKLADKGAVTREVAEEKEKLLKTADSMRKQTQARIASAKSQVSEKRAQVEKAEADAAAAQQHVLVTEADVARVKALTAYTKIRAPYDGVVTTRNVHTGHLVLPGTDANARPLLVVVKTRVMRIFVDVPEGDAALIASGSEASVTIPSSSAEPRTGPIARISWTLSANSRTLRAEIDVDNADGSLRPGMYVKARLKVAERNGVLSLPKGAVQAADGKSFCYTIDAEGIVARTPIETGIRTDEDVEIVSGLSGDEQVIGVNAAAFREGQQVEVAKPKAGS